MFDEIKFVFFDIDGVLSVPRFNSTESPDNYVTGVSKDKWLQYNINQGDAYKNCIAPDKVKTLVQTFDYYKKKLYCITVEDNSFAYHSKVDFVLRNYPEFATMKNILFVSDPLKKVEVITGMMNKVGATVEDCLVIEGSYESMVYLGSKGLRTIHISHVLNMDI